MAEVKEELYYWKDSQGNLVPKHELTDLHVCNIVMKFGKNWLQENGHNVIVKRFESLNKEYDFFRILREG